jgi:hypothetical protein
MQSKEQGRENKERERKRERQMYNTPASGEKYPLHLIPSITPPNS